MNASEFSDVFSRGKMHHGEYIFLKVMSSTSSFKIATSVSKKNIPHAVDRNILKRQLFNMVKKILPKPYPNTYIIVVVKKTVTIAEISHEKLYNDIKKTIALIMP